jgi:hypothetical protein
MFLCYDWLIMPIQGLCVEHPLSKIYWVEIFTTSALFERSTEYTDIPAKRFTLAFLALTAVIAWIWVGRETVYVCVNAVPGSSCNGQEMLSLASSIWMALTLVAICCILYLFVRNILAPKTGAAWDFLSGKLCHRIEYKKSEVHTD